MIKKKNLEKFAMFLYMVHVGSQKYSLKVSCIYEMQLYATKMNPFCIVTHVYGFGQLFHDRWQVKV
jgi:uncharacterized membrane protein